MASQSSTTKQLNLKSISWAKLCRFPILLLGALIEQNSSLGIENPTNTLDQKEDLWWLNTLSNGLGGALSTERESPDHL